jgi:hypothetical protein
MPEREAKFLDKIIAGDNLSSEWYGDYRYRRGAGHEMFAGESVRY